MSVFTSPLLLFSSLLPPPPSSYLVQNAIKKLHPAADVSGAAGRSSSFEVVVTVGEGEARNVYSKLSTGAFPVFDDLAKSIVDSAK